MPHPMKETKTDFCRFLINRNFPAPFVKEILKKKSEQPVMQFQWRIRFLQYSNRRKKNWEFEIARVKNLNRKKARTEFRIEMEGKNISRISSSFFTWMN
ncbi:hypothetical protein DLM78_00880 [Leptospira stimsonii]|uniref:Uncharacterized protein n=1 Tax=Leptospira stimsonii TaxID=2202203 RepID=A0A8B3CVT2_9LEPT|nr:hypothetical protein DLM78_00880 [Leptospira stimsonii]